MAKGKLGDRIKITSYEDMLGLGSDTFGQVDQSQGAQIIDVPLEELHDFKGHPFNVVDDEQMEEMVESIKENGVLVPAMARPRAEGGYELLSGHRRHRACELAELETMPVIIKDVSDDIATVIMVDANIQRENILVSEKARAYKMKYDAIKHQGITGGISLDVMSESSGDSKKTIQRLISMASLKPELLEMVDSKKLGLGQAYNLSLLGQEEQTVIFEVIRELGVTISLEQSEEIKEACKEGYFNKAFLKKMYTVKKPEKRKVVFNSKKLDSYFEPNMSNRDIEDLIVKLLDDWKQKGGEA